MTQQDLASPTSVAELVREIAQALVDEPSAVEVESIDRDESTVLKLRVLAILPFWLFPHRRCAALVPLYPQTSFSATR